LGCEVKSSLDRDQPDITDVSKKNQDSSPVTTFLKFCSSSDPPLNRITDGPGLGNQFSKMNFLLEPMILLASGARGDAKP
jgi:hypothetical protein